MTMKRSIPDRQTKLEYESPGLRRARGLTVAHCLVIVHTALILIAELVGCLGLYVSLPGSPYAGEIYTPYFYISGPPVACAGVYASFYMASFIEAMIGTKLQSDWTVVVFPGIIDTILGGLQWYAVGMFFRRVVKKSRASVNVSGTSLRMTEDADP
jgi:hypothetical protein